MGFFLALVMFMGCLPLNPIASYANGDVEINETNFKDENFRNYVKDRFDENKDGNLSKDELDKVEKIYINSHSVSSLKGIEHFKNLTKLVCNNNNLTSLDIRKNTKLTELNCFNNKLTELNVSNNKNLTYLSCENNYLESLDLSGNKKLIKLICSENKLTELDVSKNTNLTKLYCDLNNLKSLDVRENKNLTTLLLRGNINLTRLDLGENKNLTYLGCFHNNLTKLDISKNTNLTTLYCYDNNLKELDLSNNPNLNELDCSENKLESLDLSNNTNLTKLNCNENNLTSLDLSNNTNLNFLDCHSQQYDITVNKGIREFEYSKFPGEFNKDKVTSPDGASFGADALTFNSDNTNKVTYNYKVNDNKEMDVTLNVKYIEFDPQNVASMKVKTQPKLIYTEGEKLDLTGLEVTLTDKQGLTKDVAFKDFKANGITANPENGAELTLNDNNKPVTLTKINLTAETNTVAANNEKAVKLTKVLLTAGKNTLTAEKNPLTAEKNPLTAETNALTVNKKVTPSPTPTPDPPVVGPVDPKDPPVDPKDPPVDPKDPPVVGPEDPTQPGGKSQVANNKVLPKTASSMNIELYTIFMILSGALLVVAFKRKKES